MLNELAQELHKIAVAHGWWEKNPTFGETIALCHSELSEALEKYRNHRPLEYEADGKPEGIAVEMIDCLIRILDWAVYVDVDVDGVLKRKTVYNANRPYRHGGKEL